MNRAGIIGIVSLCVWYCSCSIGPIAGGTSTTGNSVITGVIIDTVGNAVTGAVLRMLPADYNPAEGGPIPDSMTDTTDKAGRYRFVLSDTSGVYNIEGAHPSFKTKLLITGVPVQGDTTLVLYGILKATGAIKLFLPDTIDTADGYVYLEGTTINKPLSLAVLTPENIYEIALDSVPAGTIRAVKYGVRGDPYGPVALKKNVTVSSHGITVIDLLLCWKVFNTENSKLPDNSINDVSRGNDGYIWFATNNGIACINMTNDLKTYDTANSGLPSNSVREIAHEANHSWCATYGGAAVYYNSQWTVYDTANSAIPSNFITCVDIDKKGNKWFGTLKNGLATYNGVAWTLYDTALSNLPSNEVVSVKTDKSGAVWCVTKNGVAKIDGAVWKIYTAGNSGLCSDYVYCVAIDSSGDTWFGCRDGVSRFDGNVWTTYDSNNSPLLKDSVLAITVDIYDKVWVGTSHGLTLFTGVQWTDYTGGRYELLNNKGVHSIDFDVSYLNTWIGTSSNGVIAFGPTIINEQ